MFSVIWRLDYDFRQRITMNVRIGSSRQMIQKINSTGQLPLRMIFLKHWTAYIENNEWWYSYIYSVLKESSFLHAFSTLLIHLFAIAFDYSAKLFEHCAYRWRTEIFISVRLNLKVSSPLRLTIHQYCSTFVIVPLQFVFVQNPRHSTNGSTFDKTIRHKEKPFVI